MVKPVRKIMIVCIEVKSPLRCYDNFEASPSEYSTQFLLLFPISCKFVAMKQKLKQIASLAALLIALLMSVDDGIAFFAEVYEFGHFGQRRFTTHKLPFTLHSFLGFHNRAFFESIGGDFDCVYSRIFSRGCYE